MARVVERESDPSDIVGVIGFCVGAIDVFCAACDGDFDARFEACFGVS